MIPPEALPPYDKESVSRLIGRECAYHHTLMDAVMAVVIREAFVYEDGSADVIVVWTSAEFHLDKGRQFLVSVDRLLWPERIPDDPLLRAALKAQLSSSCRTQ